MRAINRRARARKAGKVVPLRVLPRPVEPEPPPARVEPATVQGFLESLIVTQGPAAGRPLEILPWQQAILSDLADPDKRIIALSLGRGNGKSSWVAALSCLYLAGPWAQPRGDVLVVASSFGQGRVTIFETVKAFMADRLTDKNRWRVLDSMQHASIEDRSTGSRLRVVGADPDRILGAAPAALILDEPAAWPANDRDRMFSALLTSRGKVEGCRMLVLGTRSGDSAHWFESLLHGGDAGADAVHLYSCSQTVDVLDRDEWLRANPSLPFFPELEAAIAADARMAAADSNLRRSFMAYRLNAGLSDLEPYLLDVATWRDRCEVDDLPARKGQGYLGVDLGGSSAMSGASMYWPASGRVESMAAFAGIPSLRERARADSVGDAYQSMADRGELVVQDEAHTVDVGRFLREVVRRWGRPASISCDRYREAELRQALMKAGISAPLVFRGAGWKDGAADVRAFRRAVLEGRVKSARSRLLRFALSEARVAVDAAGNEKLAKGSEGHRRVRARDDAVASLILSVAAGVQSKHKALTYFIA